MFGESESSSDLATIIDELLYVSSFNSLEIARVIGNVPNSHSGTFPTFDPKVGKPRLRIIS